MLGHAVVQAEVGKRGDHGTKDRAPEGAKDGADFTGWHPEGKEQAWCGADDERDGGDDFFRPGEVVLWGRHGVLQREKGSVVLIFWRAFWSVFGRCGGEVVWRRNFSAKRCYACELTCVCRVLLVLCNVQLDLQCDDLMSRVSSSPLYVR